MKGKIPYAPILTMLVLAISYTGCVRHCYYTATYPSYEKRIVLPKGVITYMTGMRGDEWDESGHIKCCKSGYAHMGLLIAYYDTVPAGTANVLLRVDSVMLRLGGELSPVPIDKDYSGLKTAASGQAMRSISLPWIEVPCGYKKVFFIEFNLQVIDETDMSAIFNDRGVAVCKLKKGWYSPLWPGR
jgi:hypothetical protein